MNDNKEKLKIALIQLSADTDQNKNIQKAVDMTQEAINQKARCIFLPEIYAFRRQNNEEPIPFEDIPGPSTHPFIGLAKKHNVTIICGSIYEKDRTQKGYNTSVVISHNGECNDKYRKIHLFNYQSSQKKIDESKDFNRGEYPIIANIEGKKCGLSICYDLRFPELYRTYAGLGAEILSIPASFTKPTGAAHWHILCRARAIENMAFVCAANQVGIGAAGIPAYGHSLVIDPWGNILAEGHETNEEIVYATLDFEKQKKYKKDLPCITHRCL